MNRYTWLFCFAALTCCASRLCAAALIDFELSPAGVAPVDNAALAAPYSLTGGGTVSFFFDVDGGNTLTGVDTPAYFEAAGVDPQSAFNNDFLSLADTANGGTAGQLGNFFLRQLQPGSVPPPFIVDYNTAQTIAGLSGEIWDIDGAPGNTERWFVEVLDAANNVLATQASPLGNSAALDGLPWTFAFSGLPAGVDKLRITFTGSKTSDLGLAFNNFSPLVAVPEPASVLLMGMATMAALVVAARRKREVRGD